MYRTEELRGRGGPIHTFFEIIRCSDDDNFSSLIVKEVRWVHCHEPAPKKKKQITTQRAANTKQYIHVEIFRMNVAKKKGGHLRSPNCCSRWDGNSAFSFGLCKKKNKKIKKSIARRDQDSRLCIYVCVYYMLWTRTRDRLALV